MLKSVMGWMTVAVMMASLVTVTAPERAEGLFLKKALARAKQAAQRAVARAKRAADQARARAQQLIGKAGGRVKQALGKAAGHLKRAVGRVAGRIKLFSQRFQELIRKLSLANLAPQITRLKAVLRSAKARADRLLTAAKKSQLLRSTKEKLRRLRAGLGRMTRAWKALVVKPAARSLFKRILLRVARKQLDARLIADVKSIDRMLAAQMKVPPRRPARVRGPTGRAAVRQAEVVEKSDVKECAARGNSLDVLLCTLDYTHPTRAIMFSGALGLVLGGHVSAGVVWGKDQGKNVVKVMLCGGGVAGVLEEIELQVGYSLIQSAPSGAGGGSIGGAFTLDLIGGVSVGVGWSFDRKGISPAPDFGISFAVGEGAGGAFDITGCVVFP